MDHPLKTSQRVGLNMRRVHDLFLGLHLSEDEFQYRSTLAICSRLKASGRRDLRSTSCVYFLERSCISCSMPDLADVRTERVFNILCAEHRLISVMTDGPKSAPVVLGNADLSQPMLYLSYLIHEQHCQSRQWCSQTLHTDQSCYTHITKRLEIWVRQRHLPCFATHCGLVFLFLLFQPPLASLLLFPSSFAPILNSFSRFLPTALRGSSGLKEVSGIPNQLSIRCPIILPS